MANAIQHKAYDPNKLSEITKSGRLVLIVVAGGFLITGYFDLDDKGWIPHRIATRITAKNNWLVGETKACDSHALTQSEADAAKQHRGYAVGEIYCDDCPYHQMNVTFWGKINQPDAVIVDWRCTRTADSFECKEVGIETKYDVGISR